MRLLAAKLVELAVVEYPDESDPGPFPIPDNTPIEGWPAHYQRDAEKKRELEEARRFLLEEK